MKVMALSDTMREGRVVEVGNHSGAGDGEEICVEEVDGDGLRKVPSWENIPIYLYKYLLSGKFYTSG